MLALMHVRVQGFENRWCLLSQYCHVGFPVASFCCGGMRVEGNVPKDFAVLAGATSIDY